MFYEKAKKYISEQCCDIIFYPIPFCLASKLKCIRSLRKKKYSFATTFRCYISVNAIEAILSGSLLIVCISLSFTVSYGVE